MVPAMSAEAQSCELQQCAADAAAYVMNSAVCRQAKAGAAPREAQCAFHGNAVDDGRVNMNIDPNNPHSYELAHPPVGLSYASKIIPLPVKASALLKATSRAWLNQRAQV